MLMKEQESTARNFGTSIEQLRQAVSSLIGKDSKSSSKKDKPTYYSSIVYLQSESDVEELEKLRQRGHYQKLLSQMLAYDNGDVLDEERTFIKPVRFPGDDILVENKYYAVVYNWKCGGTFELYAKHSEQDVRDYITRYGLGHLVTSDVKSVARDMVYEEYKDFAIGRYPVFHMPDSKELYLRYNKERDQIEVGEFREDEFEIEEVFDYDYNSSFKYNVEAVYKELVKAHELRHQVSLPSFIPRERLTIDVISFLESFKKPINTTKELLEIDDEQYEKLPEALKKLYLQYDSAKENAFELHSSRLVCREDKQEAEKAMHAAWSDFKSALLDWVGITSETHTHLEETNQCSHTNQGFDNEIQSPNTALRR